MVTSFWFSPSAFSDSSTDACDVPPNELTATDLPFRSAALRTLLVAARTSVSGEAEGEAAGLAAGEAAGEPAGEAAGEAAGEPAGAVDGAAAGFAAGAAVGAAVG